MSSEPVFTLRWGLVATGGISQTFAKNLLFETPASRGNPGVAHKLVAVGSRSVEGAQKFIDGHCSQAAYVKEIDAKGSYQEVYSHPDVDIVYIGSPHSNHYADALGAIEAGKNVLCEKAFTVNAKQVKVLIEKAKAKDVFLMEAMWTRYFPLAKKFQELIASGRIGAPLRAFCDFSFDIGLDKLDPGSRMIDPALAGGAVLDMGPYALVWPTLAFFPYPTKPTLPKSLVASSDFSKTGIDHGTTWVSTWDNTFDGKPVTQVAIHTCTMKTKHSPVLIQGEKGEIVFEGWAPRPSAFVVKDYANDKSERFEFYEWDPKTGAANGMFWEADEAAVCIKNGLKQSSRMTWDDSIYVMETFDAVRAQTGLVYPEAIEKL